MERYRIAASQEDLNSAIVAYYPGLDQVGSSFRANIDYASASSN